MAADPVEKRFDWLDEQRRKDADLIQALQEKIIETQKMVVNQEKQAKALSSEIARIAGQASQIRQFDDALLKQREDFSRQLQDLIENQQKRDVQAEKNRNTEREVISRSVEELRVEIKLLDEIQQAIETRRHEEIRINSELDTLEKKFDGFGRREEDISRSLKSVEDSRTTDAKRIAELQSESTELRKRIESIRGLVDTIEDRSGRIETKIGEFSVKDTTRQEDQNVWMERQELRLVAFEKEWNSYLKRFEALERLADDSDGRMQKYDDNYRAMKKNENRS